MPLVLRGTKGSALTYDELDGNFEYLDGTGDAGTFTTITVSNNAIFSGATIDFSNSSISTFQSTVFYETKVDTTSNTDINCAEGNIFTSTPNTNPTYLFNNPPASGTGYSFTLVIAPTADVTVTWPASVDWAEATAPSMPISNGTKSVYVFFTYDGGTSWFGSSVGDNFG